MPKSILYIVYILMLLTGVVAMYSLLNTGNPDSLLRMVFSDPKDDFYVAVISSFIVFVLGFVVFFNRDQEGFHQLIAMNADRIRRQRKKGQSDADIADSILSALGSTSGYRHNMARKKLIIYLAEFK